MLINPGFKQAVIYGSVHTEISITWFDGGGSGHTITAASVVSESLTIDNAICDGTEFKFGGCIASALELDISSEHDLTDRYITVSCTQTATMPLYPGTNVFPGANIFPGGVSYSQSFYLFSGVVFSCKLSKNRLTRHLVAYDFFYSKGMENCIGVYSGLFSGGTVTLGDLRAAIITAYNFTEAQTVTLPADSFPIHQLPDDITELTVNDALRMIGEFNGVFLRLNGHGDIEYISIGGTASPEIYTYYIDAEAEDYTVLGYDSVDTHSVGIYGLYADAPQDDIYDLYNDLVTTGYVASATEPGDQFSPAWLAVRDNIYPNYNISAHTPFTLRAESRLWVQPGDRVSFDLIWYAPDGNGVVSKRTKTVNGIMLSRRIKGIQAMTDELKSLEN